MVRDFIATALPTKAVCWTLVAANMVCDREYVFMFWRKTLLWVGKKRVKKKEGKPLSPLFSVCSGRQGRIKIIQRVQLAVDDTTNCSFLRF